MMWRLRDLVRAGAAAGLLFATVGPACRAQEPSDAPPDASMLGRTVDILRAQQSGDLAVDARGAGDARVALRLRNTSGGRLHVVIPPGLVASAGVGQGGFQSMGLGAPSNRPEAFGRFEGADAATGFRSVPPAPEPSAEAITIPAGTEISLQVPAVCLNFGLSDPTPSDRFELMDVADFTPDARVRKALRSLATLGTDRRVAQVVMWSVCNGYTLPQLANLTPKTANRWEFALADRFIEALDSSSGEELVDPAYLLAGRVYVRVQGDGALASQADALASTFDDATLFGLSTRAVRGQDVPTASGPALYLVVTLTSSSESQTAGRVAVHGMARDGEWINGGTAKLMIEAPSTSMDGLILASAVEGVVARQFVAVRRVASTESGARFVVENGLPLTIAGLTLEAAEDGGAPFTVDALGVGPMRTAEVVVPASDLRVDRLELNGL